MKEQLVTNYTVGVCDGIICTLTLLFGPEMSQKFSSRIKSKADNIKQINAVDIAEELDNYLKEYYNEIRKGTISN